MRENGDREKMKVVQEGERQPLVVQDIDVNAELACHFITSHFLLAMNKCSVLTLVVSEQNSRCTKMKISHHKFSFFIF